MQVFESLQQLADDGEDADGDGNAASNLKLSEDRAAAVVDALIKDGVSNTRLSSKGFGMSKPIADNKTDEGKARNRRVELVRLKN